jgi:pyruvate dehydrogenase E2 component (dihydrolipoamide acetyltransferase)
MVKLELNQTQVSMNDVIIKAVAMTLKAMPEMNAMWSTERKGVELRPTIDIAVTVAVDNHNWFTPVIRQADTLSISAISLKMKELQEKAKKDQLSDDQVDGSFR